MIRLAGQVERITFHNPENHYTIARISTRESRSLVTIVGYMPGVQAGQDLHIGGSWETHPRYGQQFKITTFEIALPATVEGIRRYLESDAVKGIGRVMAGKLLASFGPRTLEIIANEPERLTEIEGIGGQKAEALHRAWKKHHALIDIMRYLQAHGVKAAYAAQILKIYGEDAVAAIQADPFRLVDDLPQGGFLIADAITRHMGRPKDDPGRIRACLFYLLDQAAAEGHVFVHEDRLIQRVDSFEIDADQAARSLEGMAARGEIVVEEGIEDGEARAVFSRELHRAEKGIAGRIHGMVSIPVESLDQNASLLAAEVFNSLAIRLSEEQLGVLEAVLAQRVAVITGGPGTGKTTLIRALCAVFKAAGRRTILAAPTGRAARRLTEVTGWEAQTIHRLLGYHFQEGRFEKNQDDPLDADAVIVDEASMVDTLLMHHLLNATPLRSRLVLVGDVFQLPSVGPGNVLDDLIRSGRLPVFYLSRIFRQARQSAIIVNAHLIRQGEFPDIQPTEAVAADTDFCFLSTDDPREMPERIIDLCRSTIPQRFSFDPIRDIQVLTPMHKGVVGTLQLNRLLQAALNPSAGLMEHMGASFRIGDKVMHLKNNYQKDVFNGDIGTIMDCDGENGRLLVDYYGRTISYETEELGEVTPAYAISVHKSQGSEYPAVIIPLVTQHYPLLQRNLLYTAVTRGKQLVVLIGSPKAFSIALHNDTAQKRFTRLRHKLENG
ncbi:MAG: ATP-dependent RecD-like DNA helicase [Thermodesulfobacteriota bacterium]